MPPVRIGLITTLQRNIGDDFIRDGVVQVLSHAFAGRDARFISVDKHRPFTVYPDWHPLRWLQGLDRLPRGRRAAERMKAEMSHALHRFGGSHFDRTDVIVQCGAPVLWPGCHRCEWGSPIWDQVVGRLSERIAILNLAAGSSYPWENQPQVVSDVRDSDFLRRILGYCRVTTARDELAARLATGLGAFVPTIPCTAFLVGRRFGVPSADDDGMVLFNYMPGGGHYEWGQGISEARWLSTARTLLGRLSSRHKVAFICHDSAEYAAAERLDPALPRYLPTTIQDYFSVVEHSKAAVVNRLHAAIAIASVGIPSISVGTDTRMLMAATIGLPHRYVKDVDADQLEHDFEAMLRDRRDERGRLIELRERTWSRYVDEVAQAVAV